MNIEKFLPPLQPIKEIPNSLLLELSKKYSELSLQLAYQRGLNDQKEETYIKEENENLKTQLLEKEKQLAQIENDLKAQKDDVQSIKNEKEKLTLYVEQLDQIKKSELNLCKSELELQFEKERHEQEKQKMHAFHQGQLAGIERVEKMSQEKQMIELDKKYIEENFHKLELAHKELIQELSKYKNRNQSGHVGADFEDYLIERLKDVFRHFFISVEKTSDRKLDIEIKTADDIFIRIDTKKYSKHLPGGKVTKFVEDLNFIEEKKVKVDICILYSNLPFAGQKPTDSLCKTYERANLIIHEIGNNAEDILITKIHESVLQIRNNRNFNKLMEHSHSLKEDECKSIQYLIESLHKMIVHQSNEIRQLSKMTKDLHGQTVPYYKQVIEKARDAHSKRKDIIPLVLLQSIESYELDTVIGGQYKIEGSKRSYNKKRKKNDQLLDEKKE